MTNPVRFCPVCETADDHPRHDFHLTDPRVAPHMDCCADVGCPDGSCPILVRDKRKRTGDDFRALLVKPTAATTKLLDARDAATRHFTLDDLKPAVHGAVVAGPTILVESR